MGGVLREPNDSLSCGVAAADHRYFAWEQAADEYGRLVVDWVSGGYQRVAAGVLDGGGTWSKARSW